TSGVNIISSDLILESGNNAIGTATKAVTVSLSVFGALNGTLTARGYNDVYISTAGDLRLEGVSSQTKGVYLNTGGSILDALDSSSPKIAASIISLTAGGSIGALENYVETDLTPDGTLTVLAAGSIYLHETFGNLNVNGIKSTAGDVYLWAHQSILDASTAPNEDPSKFGADIFGNNISLISDIGRIGIAGNDLDIDSAYSGAGMLSMSSYLGTSLREAAGDLTINQIRAGLGLGNDNIAFIEATVGSIYNGRAGISSGSGNGNILSGRAFLFARDNIGAVGAAFATEAGALEGQATTGRVYIINTGAMTLGGVTGSATGFYAKGSVDITTMSPLTVDAGIYTEDTFNIEAHDSAGDGDILLVKAGATITADNTVNLIGGDHIIIEDGAVLNAALINMSVDVHAGDVNVAGDSVGGSVEIYGLINTPSVNLYGGINGNTFAITRTETSNLTTVYAGKGNDTIYVGSKANASSNVGGNANLINGKLIINGQGGVDRLIVDDTNDVDVTALTMDRETIAAVTYGRLVGLASANILYDTLEFVEINLGDAGNIVQVKSSQAGSITTLNTGAGVDDVTVGSTLDDSTSNVKDLAGRLVVDGEGAADTLRINESGYALNTFDGVLSATTLTGLGTAGIDYKNIEILNVDLGSAEDAFTIVSTNVTTVTNVRSQEGDDTITIGAPGHTLREIAGQLYLAAGNGTGDKVVFDDRDETNAHTWTLDTATLSGSGIGLPINFNTFEYVDLTLGQGQDTLYIKNTIVIPDEFDPLVTHEPHVTINTFAGSDFVNIETLQATTYIQGGDDADTFRVNYNEAGIQTFNDGVDYLILQGDAGNDTYLIGLSGSGESDITVNGGDADELKVYGTNNPDTFLFRPNAIVAIEADDNYQPKLNAGTERVNYGLGGNALGGGVVVYGRDGDDKFVLDDTSSTLSIYGDAGNDIFQVGQIFQAPRDAYAGLLPRDYVDTTQVTLGFLTNGVSFATNLYGGIGNDNFTVYSNKADLWLYGEDDDDTFRVQSFVRVNPDDTNAPVTNVNGGKGADFITYTVNSPVRIEGGDGLDTLTVIGTEFADKYMVTDQGIFGAGLFVQYAGVEHIVLDAQAGNDQFNIASTKEGVTVTLVGGLGSDTFNIAGNLSSEPIEVVSNDLLGHSGLIDFSTNDSSIESGYNGLNVQGITASITDNMEAGVVLAALGRMVVYEAASTNRNKNTVRYSVVLSRSPEEDVFVTASPVAAREGDTLAGGEGISISIDGVVADTLIFDKTNWFTAQYFDVTATDDLLAEGVRTIVIQHTIRQGANIEDGGAYDNLQVPSMAIQVVDNDAAGVVVNQLNNQIVVSEGAALAVTNTYSNQYNLSLNRQPSGDVHVDVKDVLDDFGNHQVETFLKSGNDTDGYAYTMLSGFVGEDYVYNPLVFTVDNWDVQQTIEVRAISDGKLEGTHYARITHEIREADLANYYSLDLNNIALGLRAKVTSVDLEGNYSATVDTDSDTLTIIGNKAFAAIENDDNVVISGTKAFTMAAIDLIGNVPASGTVWTINIDGKNYSYTAGSGDTPDLTLDRVALGLEEAIEAAGYTVDVTVGTTLSIAKGGAAFVARSTSSSIVIDMDASVYDADKYAQIDITVSGSIASNGTWAVKIDGTEYQYTVGKNGEMLNLPSVDLTIVDNNVPNVLVTETGGSTRVTDPTTEVELGIGQVSTIAVADAFGLLVNKVDESNFTTSINIVAGDEPHPNGEGRGTVSLAADGATFIALSGAAVKGDIWIISVDGAEAGRYKVGGDSGTDIVSLERIAIGLNTTLDASVYTVTTQSLTQFIGDFGSAILNENGNNNSIYTAQDIDSTSWSQSANSDIADTVVSPYLTIKGAGNGESDFYKFSINPEWVEDAATVTVVFDIDHGYSIGDAILWGSELTVYDSEGNIVANAAGNANPSLGGTGSTAENDGYLEHTFTKAGTYYIGISNYIAGDTNSSGLPEGVDYDLNITIPGHKYSTFAFAPSPIIGNPNGLLQDINLSDNWYTFFNQDVGNAGNQGDNKLINSDTAYTNVKASGNGSTLNSYSFVVSGDMLSKATGTTSNDTPDTATYYTNAKVTITGEVTIGDKWEITIGKTLYSYEVQAGNTVASIVNGLMQEVTDNKPVGARYSVTVINNVGTGLAEALSIQDVDGFTLEANHLVKYASLVTQAGQVDSSSIVNFTSADIDLTGATAATGDLWTVQLTQSGVTKSYQYRAVLDDSIANVVEGLKADMAAKKVEYTVTYVASNTLDSNVLHLEDASGSFSIVVKNQGQTLSTSALQIGGTPVQDEFANTLWSTVNIALTGTYTLGETWSVTIDNGATAQYKAGDAIAGRTLTGNLEDAAAGLQKAINDLGGTYTANLIGSTTLEITDNGTSGFKVQYAIAPTPSVSELVAVNSWVKTESYANAVTPVNGELYTVTLEPSTGTTLTYSYLANSDTLEEVIQALANVINSDTTNGYKAVVSISTVGDVALTVVNPSKITFDLRTERGDVANVTTWAQTLKLGAVTSGEMFTVTMRETATPANVVVYSFEATADTQANVLAGLKAKIDAGALYIASIDTTTNTLTVVSKNATPVAFNLLLERGSFSDASAWSKTEQLVLANVNNNDVISVTLVETAGTVKSFSARATTDGDTNVLGLLRDQINTDGAYTATIDTVRNTLSVVSNTKTTFVLHLERGAFSTATTGWAKTAGLALTGIAAADDVFTIGVETGGTWTYAYFTATGGENVDAVLSGLASAGLTGYTLHTDTTTDTITAVNNAGTSFNLSIDQGAFATAATTAGWTKTIQVAFTGTLTGTEAWEVELNAGTSTDTYTINNGGTTAASVAASLQTAISGKNITGGAGAKYQAVLNGDTVTIFSNSFAVSLGAVTLTPPATTGALTSASLTDVAGWTETFELTGLAAAGKIYTVDVGGTKYSVTATGTDLQVVATALAAKITGDYTAFAGVNNAGGSENTITVKSATPTNFSAKQNVTAASASAAPSWAKTVQLTGATTANTTYAVSLDTNDNFSVVADGTLTLDQLATNLASIISAFNSGNSYIAFNSGNNSITILEVAESNTFTVNTAVQAGDAWSDASAWAKTYALAAASSVEDSTWLLALPGSEYYSTAGASTLSVASATLASNITSGSTSFRANVTGNGTITILREGSSTTSFNAITALPADGFSDAASWSETVQLSGTVADNKTWAVALNDGADTDYYAYTATASNSNITDGLAVNVSGNYTAFNSGNGTVTFLRSDTTKTVSVNTIKPATTASLDPSWVKTVLVGNQNESSDAIVAKETWKLTLDGTAIDYFAGGAGGSEALTLAQVATTLNAGISGAYQHSLTSATNATWYVLTLAKLDGSALVATSNIVGAPVRAIETLSGETLSKWSVNLDLNDSTINGDEWSVSLGGQNYLVDYALGSSVEDIVGALETAIGTDYIVTIDNAANGILTIARADGAQIVVGKTENLEKLIDRPGDTSVTFPATIVDGVPVTAPPHYTEIDVALSGEIRLNDTWLVTLNGKAYTTTVGVSDSRGVLQNIEEVAADLAAAIDSSLYEVNIIDGSTLRISVKSAAWFTGFSVAATQGDGTAPALFDIDNANLVIGKEVFKSYSDTQVVSYYTLVGRVGYNVGYTYGPYYDISWLNNPSYAWVLQDYTLTPQYETQTVVEEISYDYTEYLTLALFDQNGDLIERVNPYLDGPLTGYVDPGSALASDPQLYSALDGEGTYKVVLESYRDYAINDGRFEDGYLGNVSKKQSYDLVVSIQNHEVNKDAVLLVGKALTVTDGTGKGQVSTIVAYDPATKTYTLDHRVEAVGTLGTISNSDKFKIDYLIDSLGYLPNSDTFNVVLTGEPGDQVTVDVSPQITPTYNADKAFSAKDNYGQSEAVQVDVATPQAKIILSYDGGVAANETWTLTLNGVSVSYLSGSGGDALTLEVIAQRLAEKVNADDVVTGYLAITTDNTLLITRYDVDTFVGDHESFIATMAVSPETLGGYVVAPALDGKSAEIGLTGEPAIAETWTTTLVLPSGNVTYTHTVEYGDDLAKIAEKISNDMKENTDLRVLLKGRVITVSMVDGSAINASFAITPDSKGSSGVIQQLVFSADPDDWNAWNKSQSVKVAAVDNKVLEGGDLKVFAAMDEQVNRLRGPIFIDGGLQAGAANILSAPLMLTGENNLPQIEGSVSSAITVAGNTLTDTLAVYNDPYRGLMPGFDPRFDTSVTTYLYELSIVDGPGEVTTRTVESLSGTTIAIKSETGLAFEVAVSGQAAGSVITGTVASAEKYTSADLVLEGSVFKGQEWTITLSAGTSPYTYIGGANDDDLTLTVIAQRLAEMINADTSLTRTATAGRGLIHISDTAGFSLGIVKGRARVSGVALDSITADWKTAQIVLDANTPIDVDNEWTVTIGGLKSFTYTVRAGDTLASVTQGLADLIDRDAAFYSSVKFDTVIFTQPWGIDLSAGTGYLITPLNSNNFVSEPGQVDVVNVYNRNSVSNDAGTLTEDRLYGLGMGPTSVIGGETVLGGISYTNLEQVNIYLGSGKDQFTVESTHQGTTAIYGGAGDNVIDVNTIAGHTTIDGGTSITTGNVVNVGSTVNMVDQITGLLTVVGGVQVVDQVSTGLLLDTVNIVDTGDHKDNVGTLTSTTLTGLGMPAVEEVQLVTIRAQSGEYKLSYAVLESDPAAAVETLSYRQEDFANNTAVANMQTAMRSLFGSEDINVAEYSRREIDGDVRAITYTVSFVNTLAGLDMASIVWSETRLETLLVNSIDESVDVSISTKRQGSTQPNIGNVQTFSVNATGGKFALTLNVLDEFDQSQTTIAIDYNATAEEVRTALDPILNPNGSMLDPENPRNDNSRPYTNNVSVTKVDNTFMIAFQGEYKDSRVLSVDTLTGAADALGGTVEVATRTNGINYYGIQTLNVNLGSGSDVFNIQSTNLSTITYLNTGAGDDEVYVSSTANVNQTTGKTGFLTGNVIHFSGDDTPAMLFELTEAAELVKVEITDATGALVHTIDLVGGIAAGTHSPVWNGMNGDDEVLAAGAYSFTVTATRADTSTFAGITSMQGSVDEIEGLLNIDAGEGTNALIVSNISSRVDDADVTISNNQIQGLGQAKDINYVAAAGTFAGGITIWSGYGDDTISVLSTLKDINPAVRTITTLNTGLGDDDVTVSLIDGTDGFFVLNTQGQFDHDYLGTPITDTDTVDATASSLPLIIFGGQGEDDIQGGSGNDIIFGDRGSVVYYDADTPLQVLGNGGLGDKTDGLAHLVGTINTVDLGVGSNDWIRAGEGDNIVFGGANGGAEVNGFDGDTLTAGPGNDIIIGDNGELKFNATGFVVEYRTTDTLGSTGGDDTIFAGEGSNTVLGGVGSDAITAGNGTDTILGDNGSVEMDDAGAFFKRIESNVYVLGTTDEDLTGGIDTITTSEGTKIILGGFGADVIKTDVDVDGLPVGTGSNHIIIGDNGVVDYTATGLPLNYQTTDMTTNTGGGDTIITGNGNNVILAGMGDDDIMTAAGSDVIIGDNGFVQMDAAGINFAKVGTKSQPSTTGDGSVIHLGGTDTITTTNGDKVILGGDGADSITAENGNHIVFGDNGQITYVAMGAVGAGLPLLYETTDTLQETGGNDIITLCGDNVVFGGMGDDEITTCAGIDTIFGDNGLVQMSANGANFAQITSSQVNAVGNDIITTLDGPKVIIAGAANDVVDTGTGPHIITGDNGSLTYAPTGIIARVSTIAPTVGGNDTVTVAGGDTVVLGGFGNDNVVTSAGNDVLLGDTGFVSFNVLGRLLKIETTQPTTGRGTTYNDSLNADTGQNVVLGGDGRNLLFGSLDNDVLIGNYASIDYNPQDYIYSLVRFMQGNDLIGATQDGLGMTGESSLGNVLNGDVFRYFYESFNVENSSANSYYTYISPLSMNSRDDSNAPGSVELQESDNPAVDGEQGEVELTTITTQKTPETDTDDVPVDNMQDTDDVPAPSVERSPSEVMPASIATQVPESLEILLAGMMGAQAIAQISGRAKSNRNTCTEGKVSSVAEGGNWVGGANGSSEVGVLLDRRQSSREGANVSRRISEGALEKVAENWLDSAFGVNVSAENSIYSAKTAVIGTIDWGKALEVKTNTLV
ncbi:MAG: hypothetical protein ACI8PW_000192, partial [Methylophilaceae bacterium]